MAEPKLPVAPLWGFLTLPRGRLLKVHAEPCIYAPGYLQSNKPRWPAAAAGVAASDEAQPGDDAPDVNQWRLPA